MSIDCSIIAVPKTKQEAHTLSAWLASGLESWTQVSAITQCDDRLESILKLALDLVPPHSLSESFKYLLPSAPPASIGLLQRILRPTKGHNADMTAAYEVYRNVVHMTFSFGQSSSSNCDAVIDSLAAAASNVGLQMMVNGQFVTQIETDPRKSPDYKERQDVERIKKRFDDTSDTLRELLQSAIALKGPTEIAWKIHPVTLNGFVAVITFSEEDYKNGYHFVNRETKRVLDVLKKCHKKFDGVICEKRANGDLSEGSVESTES